VIGPLRRAWIAFAPHAFARWGRPDDRELGLLGEELAARELRRRGWRVLGRRVRTPRGEVDLVVALGGQVWCIEVKSQRASSAPLWRPGERFRDRDRSRQLRAARFVAGAAQGRGAPARVDLIEVWIDTRSGSARVQRRAAARAAGSAASEALD
jgi:putative endonuclease